MELNSILAVDFNSLSESATALWVMIGTLGVGTVISVGTFIKTSVSGKKFTKVSDFAVVADQSIKFAKSEITNAKKQIVEETRTEIVEPLKEQVQVLVSDNAKLSSLVVSLLSYIPLPLEVKKPAVAVIGTLGQITPEVIELIEATVSYQEKQAVIENEQDTELTKSIDDI